MLILHQFFKKVIRQAKVALELLVPFLISEKDLKKIDLCSDQFIFGAQTFQNVKQVSIKIAILNTIF